MFSKIQIPLWILIFILLLNVSCSVKQSVPVTKLSAFNSSTGFFRIMFYNAENLFDCFNDSLTNDEEFLPDRERFWTENKYYTKLQKTAKVIVAVGQGEPPGIVGLCEIENRYVLDGLLNKTMLSLLDYRIIHKESPDRRGIDVALLYREKLFQPLKYKAIPITFPFDSTRKTRDILYVKGIAKKTDTLHIFINHWPSRWGGQVASEKSRVHVASVVRSQVDSIFRTNPKANIIITGDFNDEPEDRSMRETLNAKTVYENVNSSELYNLSYNLHKKTGLGSLKYQGEWGMLDQFIVSGNLLMNKPAQKQSSVYLTLNDVHVFNENFLLENDESSVGVRPNRTFIGMKFHGGFSDHLPVYLDLRCK